MNTAFILEAYNGETLEERSIHASEAALAAYIRQYIHKLVTVEKLYTAQDVVKLDRLHLLALEKAWWLHPLYLIQAWNAIATVVGGHEFKSQPVNMTSSADSIPSAEQILPAILSISGQIAAFDARAHCAEQILEIFRAEARAISRKDDPFAPVETDAYIDALPFYHVFGKSIDNEAIRALLDRNMFDAAPTFDNKLTVREVAEFLADL